MGINVEQIKHGNNLYYTITDKQHKDLAFQIQIDGSLTQEEQEEAKAVIELLGQRIYKFADEQTDHGLSLKDRTIHISDKAIKEVFLLFQGRMFPKEEEVQELNKGCDRIFTQIKEQLLTVQPSIEVRKTKTARMEQTARKTNKLAIGILLVVLTIATAASMGTLLGLQIGVLAALSAGAMKAAIATTVIGTTILLGSGAYLGITARLELAGFKRLFAHIHGDRFIQSTGLEISTPFIAMKNVSAVITKQIRGLDAKLKQSQLMKSDKAEIDLLDAKRKKLRNLLASIQRGANIIEDIASVAKKVLSGFSPAPLPGTKAATHLRNDFIEKMQKSILGLSAGESILCPGGYAGLRKEPPGHSVYYHITKASSSPPEYTFKVYNSGDGIEYHQGMEILSADAPQRSPLLRDLQLPYLEFQHIDEEHMTDRSFWQGAFEIAMMIKMEHNEKIDKKSEHTSTNYGIPDIYRRLLPLLGGTRIEPPIDPNNVSQYINPQRSGTCTWSSLMAAMHDCLSPQEFALLEHDIQLDSIVEFMRDDYRDLNKLQGDEEARMLFRRSVEQFASRTLIKHRQGFLTLEQFTEANEIAKAATAHVDTADMLHQKQLAVKAARVVFAAETQTSERFPPGIPKVSLEATKEHFSTQALWDTNWAPHVATIDQDLKQFCEQYTKAVPQEPLNAAQSLKALIMRLPMPTRPPGHDPFWSQLPENQIESSMKHLFALSELCIAALRNIDVVSHQNLMKDFRLFLFKILAIQLRLTSQHKSMAGFNIQDWGFEYPGLNTTPYGSDLPYQMRDLYGHSGDMNGYVTDLVSEKTHHNSHILELQNHLRNYFPRVERDNFFNIYRDYRHPERQTLMQAHLDQGEEKFVREYVRNLDEPTRKRMLPLLDPRLQNKGYEGLLDMGMNLLALGDLEGQFMPLSFCVLKRQAMIFELFLENQFIKYSPHAPAGFQRVPGAYPYLSNIPLPYSNYTSGDFSGPRAAISSYDYQNSEISSLFGIRTQMNQICTPPYSASLTSELIELRSILAVEPIEGARQPQELQIVHLLEYFTSHLHTLNEHDRQVFFRHALFQNDYLRVLFQNNPEIGRKLVTFLQRAYSHFKARADVSGMTFVLNTTQLLEDKLADIPTARNALEILRKEGIDSETHGGVAECLQQLINLPDLDIQEKGLIFWQFLFYVTRHWNQWSNKERNAHLHDILTAYAFLHTTPLPGTLRNSFVEDTIEHFRWITIVPLIKNTIASGKNLQDFCSTLGHFYSRTNPQSPPIDWTAVHWENNPPYCVGTIEGNLICTFHTEDLTFSIRGARNAQLPLGIASHPNFVRNFPNPPAHVHMIAAGIYEFRDSHGLPVRVRQTANELVIQRKFEQNGPFYQFISEHYLTHYMNSRQLRTERTHWLSTTGQRIAFCIPGRDDVTHRLEPSGRNQFNIIETSSQLKLITPNRASKLLPLINLLRKCESDENIHILCDRNTGFPRRIELTGLGLSFTIVPDPSQRGKFRARCDQETNMFLSEQQFCAELRDFQNYLVLESTNKAGEKTRKILIPRKPMESPDKQKGSLRSGITLSQTYVAPESSTRLPSFFSYSINARGEFQSNHEEGTLFLSYLLFGQKRYSEAQKYLRALTSRSKRYSARENEILSWLRQYQSESRSNDPRTSAVILTATAIALQCQQVRGGEEPGLINAADDAYFRDYLTCTDDMADLLLHPAEELTLLQRFERMRMSEERKAFVSARIKLLSDSLGGIFSITFTPHHTFSIERPGIDLRWLIEVVYAAVKEEKHVEIRPRHLLTRPNENILFKEIYEKTRKESIANPTRRREIARRLDTIRSFSNQPLYVFLSAVALYPDHFPDWKELMELRGPRSDVQPPTAFKVMVENGYNIYKQFAVGLKEIRDQSVPPQSKEKATLYSKEQVQAKGKDAAILNGGVYLSPSIISAQEIFSRIFAESEKVTKETLKTKVEKEVKAKQTLAERENQRLAADIKAYQNQEHPSYRLKNLTNPIDLNRDLSSSFRSLEAQRIASNLESQELQKQILALANRESSEVSKVQKERAALLARQQTPFDLEGICICLLKGSLDEFQKRNPALTGDDVRRLRGLVTSYLVRRTHEQALIRQAKALDAMSRYISQKPPPLQLETDSEFQDLSNKAAQELSGTRAFDPTQNFPCLLFEFYNGVLLRRDQIDNLSLLERSPNKILQMIMGSGKSKVLLPILAFSQADGEHLPVIVLPQSLYASTVNDLRRNVGNTFNRAIHTLSFARNTEFTVEKLQNIHNYLQRILRNRECLIMTDKSLHCLSLKFQEALKAHLDSPTNDDLRQKVHLLQQILRVFKKSRAIIDEADLVLNCRHEVNFTLEKAEQLDPNRYQLVTDLYAALLHPTVQKSIGGDPVTQITLSKEHYHKHVKPSLIYRMIDLLIKKRDTDILGAFFHRLDQSGSEEMAQAIYSYLSGQQIDEKYLHSLDPVVKDLLALLKEQLNKILPLTLSKTCHVNYGPSLRTLRPGRTAPRTAIPYRGNNTPLESSSFGNPYELMNYTIQMYWQTGLPTSIIERIIRQWQEEATREIALHPGLHEFETAAHKKFRELCPDRSLNLFSWNARKLQRFTDRINSYRHSQPNHFFDIIREYVLPSVTLFKKKLTSNPLQLTGMLGSKIGFTGTPWIADSFAEELRKNTVVAVGTDGKSITILREKTAQKDGISEIQPGNSLDDLLQAGPDALIDVGAVFRGRSNESVARDILTRLPITKEGVIFFQRNVAVVLERMGSGTRIVPLANSTLRPEQLYVYYDQPHTTGVDITLSPNAQACLTVGKDVMSRDLFQGAWRLRGLDRQQRITIKVTQDASQRIHELCHLQSSQELRFDDVLAFTNHSQQQQQISHIFTSIKQKVKHVIKQLVLDRLLELNLNDAATTKMISQMKEELEKILVTEMQDNPFDTFGLPNELVLRDEALEALKNRALRSLSRLETVWPQFLAGIPQSSVSAQIDQSINPLRNLLPERIDSSLLGRGSKDSKEDRIRSAPETESEQELQQEQEQEAVTSAPQTYENSNFEIPRFWWGEGAIQASRITPPPQIFQNKEFDSNFDFLGLAIQGAMPDKTRLQFSHLANNILISNNRMPSRKEFRFDLWNRPQLPSQYLLFYKDKDSRTLRACLIDRASDLPFLWRALSEDRQGTYPVPSRDKEFCLCTLSGEIIQHDSSVNPEDPQNPFMVAFRQQSQKLLVQTKLLLGEFSFSESELKFLDEIVKECGGRENVLEYFRSEVFRRKPEKRAQFRQSPLFNWFGRPQFS